MKIDIAGAGAGKTTKIADRITSKFENLEMNLNIYCIAFTNNAVEHIADKLSENFGMIPARIKVSTIHSFLYQEIIRPYYYLLYGKQYNKISNIALPTEPQKKNWEIAELERMNILHITVIPQRAKWVISKKSGDLKRQKDIRKIIRSTFEKYCGAIFIDEAQDIEGEFLEMLKILDSIGIQIELMGDPKQDLRGFGNLQKLVELYPENVNYITECHRCPQKHLFLSNTIVRGDEKQRSQKMQGTLTIIFESECSVQELINESCFDLEYISTKNKRFETHDKGNISKRFEKLNHEIKTAFSTMFSDISDSKIEQNAYYMAYKLINNYKETNDAMKTMNTMFSSFCLKKKDYAKIIQALQITNDRDKEKIYVRSIESIKGQEGNNCLFVLTTDLAAYLFAKKNDDNKTKNKLYVALTRSLDKLTILVTREVEEKYGQDCILVHIN